jgi:uncharacterized membrane protein YkoI
MLKRIAAGLIMAAALAVAGSPAAQAGCLSDSQTRQAIASGQAVSPQGAVGVAVAAAGGGQALAVRLCDGGGGRMVWIVQVLNGGDQKRVTVDAQSGAVH